jgi:hypothetical protein
MYLVLNVVKRSADHIVIYRCLQRISDGVYFVQSADRIRLPVHSEYLKDLDKQFWELLLENEPDTRSQPAQTLGDAIRTFEDYFAE